MTNKEFKIYRLNFKSGLHYSGSGFAYESAEKMIHSDTLFSAFCHCYKQLYGTQSLLEDILLPEQPPFKVSSCFPFQGDQYFLPPPLKIRDYKGEGIDFGDQKAIRKAKWIPLPFFEDDLQKKLVLKDWSKYIREEKKEKKKLSTEVDRPRVVVDRVNSGGQIFHFAEVLFDKEAGLYFFVEFDKETNESFTKRFNAVMHFMGDEGIGADRTVGKGHFEPKEAKINIELPEAKNNYILLSLFNPTPADLASIDEYQSSYRYLVRNGWIYSGSMNLRRHSIRMLQEGSIIKVINNKALEGRLVEVLAPSKELNHAVYRSGLAFCLPIQL